MMNISKSRQAHKLPKAATSSLQLVQSEANFSFPDFSLTFSIFPDFSLTTGIPRLFQVFQVSGHPDFSTG